MLGVDPKTDRFPLEGVTYRLPTWGQYRQLLQDTKKLQAIPDLEQMHAQARELLGQWTVDLDLDALTPLQGLSLAGSLASNLLEAEAAAKKASASTTP